jgi:hypothetical protein
LLAIYVPHFNGTSEAPTTATEPGLNKLSIIVYLMDINI